MSFKNIIKLHGILHRLGKDIMKHKNTVGKLPEHKRSQEFDKQENRIQKFMQLSEQLKRRSKKAYTDINFYWTGY